LLTGVADRGGAVVDPRGLKPGLVLEAKRARGSVAAAPGGTEGLAGSAFLDRAGAAVLLEAASTNFEDAQPGWGYVQTALDRRMDVVLASKGALVLHFREVMDSAGRSGCRVLFAATVGAPLPILELADRVLVGADILGFEGILNATTNQILTTMTEGASYEEGVRLAQQIGIAETDPTLDVDGWDAAAKAVIVSNAVLGASLRLDDVEREGIRAVTQGELEKARMNGESIKLIARARRVDGTVGVSVKPERRPLTEVLGRLRNDEMGILFETDPLGRVAATVQQTGGIPTALTVLRDVFNLARDRGWSLPSPG
jgi:homoserine dehydrogenase